MNWLAALLRRARESRDLSAEVQAHLEEKTEALMASGMSETEARLAARKAFGNVAGVEETSRDVWLLPTLDSVVDDVRHAFRLIRRHPAFAANVVLVAGLGIATCATTYGIVSGVLLSPLGFPSPQRVFAVDLQAADGREYGAIPTTAYDRIAAGAPGIESITTDGVESVRIEWNGEPEELDARTVTPSYFRVYRVDPVLGRPFTQEEGDQLAPVVILGDRIWRDRFHGDKGIVGKTLTLNGAPYTVIGVMPHGFHAYYYNEPAFWLPSRVGPGALGGPYGVSAQVRLTDGATARQVAAVLSTLTPARMLSGTGDSVAASLHFVPVIDELVGPVELPLRILFGAVLLVLALVSANVATMQLARTAGRGEELAVRRAIGGTGWRQARLLLTESLVLTGIGGVCGLTLSVWATGAISRLGLQVMPRMDAVTFNWRVVVFAGICTGVIALAGGLAPALTVSRRLTAPTARARVTGVGTSSTLVVSQVAVSVLLLIGAGLLTKQFLRVLPSHPGFETIHRATVYVSLDLDPDIPKTDGIRARGFVDDVRAKMVAVPGVTDVAAMSFAPYSRLGERANIEIPTEPAPVRPFTAWINLVSDNWLDVMKIQLAEGRGFTGADATGAPPVAIVNQTAAARWWPEGGPIVGRQVVVSFHDGRRTVTIVGVSNATRFWGFDSKPRPEIFLPMAQTNPRQVTFVAATAGEPATLTNQLKHAVWAVAPRVPVSQTSDLETIAMSDVRQPRFFAWAIGSFSVAAVVLGALAVYGLLSFLVAGRIREIGIRLAIGASPGRIGRSVLARAVGLGGAGVAIGVVAGWALTRFMADLLAQDLLAEVKPTDASVFIGASAVVLAFAVVAATGPAWRALHVDPATTLRTE